MFQSFRLWTRLMDGRTSGILPWIPETYSCLNGFTNVIFILLFPADFCNWADKFFLKAKIHVFNVISPLTGMNGHHSPYLSVSKLAWTRTHVYNNVTANLSLFRGLSVQEETVFSIYQCFCGAPFGRNRVGWTTDGLTFGYYIHAFGIFAVVLPTVFFFFDIQIFLKRICFSICVYVDCTL